jgi:hypothetical protein
MTEMTKIIDWYGNINLNKNKISILFLRLNFKF